MRRNIQFAGFSLLICFLFWSQGLQAQCTGGTNMGSITPGLVAQTIGCIQGGQYYTFTGVAGNSYVFSFCSNGGSAGFDTQITILDATGTPAGAYNDDFCGLQSEVVFTPAATATYRVLVNEYNCTGNATCGTLSYIQLAPLGPGQNCANPFVIPALPYNNTGMTTCGYLDDYSSADACGSVYMNGDDFVFTYTSAGNEQVTINLTNTGTYTGIFVMDGCPNAAGTNCIPVSGGATNCTGGTGGTNEAVGGNPFGTWNLTAAGTYYFVVSTFPAPQCTGFDISITSAPLGGGGGGPGLGCYTVNTSIPYSPDPLNLGTTVSFPDDEFSGVLPIGFQFCFMGTPYNNFVISSNGYITFNNSCAGQYSPYVTVPIPAPAQPEVHNSILGFWQDIDPSVGGNLRYRVLGVAPNRRLNINFDQIPMFSATCNALIFNGQITLHETTNNIDVFIQNKPLCPSWNGGNAVQGLLDATGTVAIQVPGRNNTNWLVNNDAVRFSPTCDVCQVILDANYRNLSGIPSDQGNKVQWETTTEENLTQFVLEHSRDGQSFESVGSQASLGSNTSGAFYEMLDAQPFHPVTHYRLRELSLNGDISYSEVIQVKSDLISTPLTNLFVDVATQELVVDFQAESSMDGLRLDVVDGLGRVQYRSTETIEVGASQLRLPLEGLSAGYYFLQVSGPENIRDTRKFILY